MGIAVSLSVRYNSLSPFNHHHICIAGSFVYSEENTQQSTGSFCSENMNEDSNMSFPDHSENSPHNENTQMSHDSNDAYPEMRVGKVSTCMHDK